jgi:hypothetical protein
MEDKTRQSQSYLENILLYTVTFVQYLIVHNNIWTRFYCPNIGVTEVSNYSFVYFMYYGVPPQKTLQSINCLNILPQHDVIVRFIC